VPRPAISSLRLVCINSTNGHCEAESSVHAKESFASSERELSNVFALVTGIAIPLIEEPSFSKARPRATPF